MEDLQLLTAFRKFQFPIGSELRVELASSIGTVRDYIVAAKLIAEAMRGAIVSFHANDILIYVDDGTNVEAIMRDFERASHGFIDPVVGPRPDDELNSEDNDFDAKIEDAQKRLNSLKRAARAARKARKHSTETES